MQVELRDDLGAELTARALQAGVAVDTYLETMLFRQPQDRASVSNEERQRVVDAQLKYLQTSSDAGGRAGRSWSSFIHEGHRY